MPLIHLAIFTSNLVFYQQVATGLVLSLSRSELVSYPESAYQPDRRSYGSG